MNISHSIEKLIFDQTVLYGKKLSVQMPDYDKRISEINRLFDGLKAELSPEAVSLWLAYEEKINDLHSLAEAFMYEQGLKDGVALAMW